MGIYYGSRAGPCPRCGGVVGTTFISITPMSFSQRCQSCGVTKFTEAEESALGDNVGDESWVFSKLGIDLDDYPVVKGGAV